MRYRPWLVALFLIRCRRNGFCAGATINVRGTSRAVGVQFFGRRVFAGGIGRRLRDTQHVFDGGGGSRRVVWLTAFSSSDEKTEVEGARRGGGELRRRWQDYAAGCFSRRLPEPLPSSDADETESGEGEGRNPA